MKPAIVRYSLWSSGMLLMPSCSKASCMAILAPGDIEFVVVLDLARKRLECETACKSFQIPGVNSVQ